MNERIVIAALAGIVALGILLSCLFYTGPFYSFDDHFYINEAHQILTGAFSVAQSPYAYGFFVPATVAASFALSGAGVFSAALPELVEYVLLIIVAYLIGRRLYGNGVGLLAAFLCAVAPFVIGYTTRVLPDMLVGLLAALSIYVMLLAVDMMKGYHAYAIAGALAGLTIFAKLIGIAFMLFFFIGMFAYYLPEIRKRRGKPASVNGVAMLCVLAGLLAALAAYLAIFFATTGNPLYGITSYGQYQAAAGPSSLGENLAALAVTGAIGYATQYTYIFSAAELPQLIPVGLLLWLSLLGFIIAIYKMERGAAFLGIAAFGFMLYLFFGTDTLGSYHFIIPVSRYFIAIAAPMAVLASRATVYLGGIAGKHFGKRAGYALMVALVSATVIFNLPSYSIVYNYNMAIRENNNVLAAASAYVTGTVHGQQLFVDNVGYVPYLEMIGGYAWQANVTQLDISNINALGRQMLTACNSAAAHYALFVYDEYSRALGQSEMRIVEGSLAANCTMNKTASFFDAQAANAAYGYLDINATFFSISGGSP